MREILYKMYINCHKQHSHRALYDTSLWIISITGEQSMLSIATPSDSPFRLEGIKSKDIPIRGKFAIQTRVLNLKLF